MFDNKDPRKTCFDGDKSSVLAFRVNVEWEAPHGYVIHLAEALEKGDVVLPHARTLITALIQFGEILLGRERALAVLDALRAIYERSRRGDGGAETTDPIQAALAALNRAGTTIIASENDEDAHATWMRIIPTLEERQVTALCKLHIVSPEEQRTHQTTVRKFLVKALHKYDQRVLSFMQLILDKANHEYSGTLAWWEFLKHFDEHHSSNVTEAKNVLVKCICNFNSVGFRSYQINIMIHYDLYKRAHQKSLGPEPIDITEQKLISLIASAMSRSKDIQWNNF